MVNIFDSLTEEEQKRKVELREQIRATEISSLHPTFDRDELCQALVAQYLSHDGHVQTARAFSEEVCHDNNALTGNASSALDGFLAVEHDQDAKHRQGKPFSDCVLTSRTFVTLCESLKSVANVRFN